MNSRKTAATASGKRNRPLVEAIMRGQLVSREEALELISQAAADLTERLTYGRDAEDICMDWFGLEPDYLPELMEELL